jgi:hypothetical protein
MRHFPDKHRLLATFGERWVMPLGRGKKRGQYPLMTKDFGLFFLRIASGDFA